jgi:hypothetical protein
MFDKLNGFCGDLSKFQKAGKKQQCSNINLENIRNSNILRNNEFLLSTGLAPIQKQESKTVTNSKKANQTQ